MLVDSNIIIYAAKPEHDALRRFIAEHTPGAQPIRGSLISTISYLADPAAELGR